MKQLKKRILKGDPDAFVELHEMYGDRMLRYLKARLHSADAADVMQEVFVRLFRYRRKLAKARNLEAYIFLTVRNEAARWATGNRKHHQAHEPLLEANATSTDRNDRSETAEWVQSLLQQVSAKCREIIELKIYSGLTFTTIAEMLNLPAATVATRYRRAILKLQKQIEPDRTQGSGLIHKAKTRPGFQAGNQIKESSDK